MPKILIRCGMLPFDSPSYEDMIETNLVGANIGNLIYQYSIVKSLMVDEDTEFIPTKYRYNFSDEEIDKINEECDCFVIPLADAFRATFIKELNAITRTVNKLQIPCYVIGAGLKAPLEPVFSFPFDEDVKAFIKAILNKSVIIGLRGEVTAEYLKRLGFKAEEDYTVIGCPSMYLNKELSVKKGVITEDSVVSYNISPEADSKVISYIKGEACNFKERYYLPQNTLDLNTIYIGRNRGGVYNDGYPLTLQDLQFQESRFFNNIPSWQNFLKKTDFAFGTRLHGNIMALLSGVPALHIQFDTRTREVTQYHKLPYIKKEDIGKNMIELANKIDYSAAEEVQKQNFAHYTDFLDKNGIDHIWKRGDPSIFDKRIKEVEVKEPLIPLTMADKNEMIKRSAWYADFYKGK